MATLIDPGYKKAAIDWLLAHGICDSMTTSTCRALFDLADRGVDYEASEMPDFRHVAIKPGDTINDPVYADALSATITPVGSTDFRDTYDFVVSPDQWNSIVFSFILRGVLAAAEAGDTDWKARYPEQRARHDERIAEQAAREAGYAAAREAKAAAVAEGADVHAQDRAARAAYDAAYAASVPGRP